MKNIMKVLGFIGCIISVVLGLSMVTAAWDCNRRGVPFKKFLKDAWDFGYDYFD